MTDGAGVPPLPGGAGGGGLAAVGDATQPPWVARAWLETLRGMADRTAHEVRGALNGVALNLEVVRARSEKGAANTAGVARYAAAAADQLEAVTARAEALLSLTRAPRHPIDVAAAARDVVTLLAPSTRSEGGSLALETADAETVTAAEPEVVRLVIAAVLLAAIGRPATVLCRIAVRDAIILRVEGAGGSPGVAPDVARAAADAGIGIEHHRDAFSVAFPVMPR